VTTRDGNSQLEHFAAGEYRAVVSAVARITGDSLTAADSVQDAVLTWLENPPREPVANIAAWITVVAANRTRDRQRRRSAESRALARVGLPVDIELPTSIDADLRAAIEALPLRQREICILHYVLDESVESIATSLAVSSGAVKTHLFRGRRALAARLAPVATAA
jgi:RNA polymerase sigma-70 factor (ECF subfamily)